MAVEKQRVAESNWSSRASWKRNAPFLVKRLFRGFGFSLIELLVVVSIVALLLSVLLPSLKKAREAAKVTMCAANARGIASASLTYAAQDPHEQVIPVHHLAAWGNDLGAYDWGGKSGRGEQLASNDPTSSIWGTANGFGPATRALNDIVFKTRFTDYQDAPGPNQSNWENDCTVDMPIYRCPGDRGYTGHHYPMWADSRLSSYNHYGTSYAGNVLFNYGTMMDEAAGTSAGASSLSPYLYPLSRTTKPANTVYYLENSGRFAWHVNYATSPEDRYYGVRCGAKPGGLSSVGIWAPAEQPAVVKGWHGRAFHIVASFVDGHAGLVKMEGRTVPAPYVERYDGLPAVGCWIIRGPGWQIDNVPNRGGNNAITDWLGVRFTPNITKIQ